MGGTSRAFAAPDKTFRTKMTRCDLIYKPNTVNLLLLNMYDVDFLSNPRLWNRLVRLKLNPSLLLQALSTKPAQRELQLPLIQPVLGKHAKHLGLSWREPYYSWSIILLVL